MLRPEITPEMKTLRENGAKNCLRSVDKYVLSVAYSDTQRFSYDEEGKIYLNFGHEKITPNTVVVWGGISSHPKASLCRVTGRFDSSTYTNILQQHIIPLTKKDPSKRTGLVHDWFPVYRSKNVMDFIAKNLDDIVVLDWPKSFGDVMPLERVWMEMGEEFSKGNIKAADEESLWRAISLMWNKLCNDDFVIQLIQDIPSKLRKVEQCGGITYVD